MVEAIVTGIILITLGGCTAVILQCIPDRHLNKLWEKFHLDNDEPYGDIQED